MIRRRVAALVTLLLLVGGCGLPHRKTGDDASKRGVTFAAAGSVVANFNRVRAAADRTGDVGRLSRIEQGSLLDVDEGAAFVRRRLALETRPVQLEPSPEVVAPAFREYPLWFAAFADVPAEKQRTAAVFVRESSTSPWLLTYAPRLARSTEVPGVELHGGVAVAVPGEGSDLPASPQQLVDRYVDVLATPSSASTDGFVEDSFIRQMRELRAAQPTGDITFSQRWSARPVRYALRLADGGALVFATLVRTDRYRVHGTHALQWQGSEPAAYFRQPVRRSAALVYNHQILMLVPPRGKPLVIGQYGGIVRASGS